MPHHHVFPVSRQLDEYIHEAAHTCIEVVDVLLFVHTVCMLCGGATVNAQYKYKNTPFLHPDQILRIQQMPDLCTNVTF